MSNARILYQAVIPTNSLRLICERTGDRLNGKVHMIRGTSTWQPSSPSKEVPEPWLRLHTTTMVKCYLQYNSATAKSRFTMDKIMDTLDENRVHDIWLHELRVRLKHSLGLFDFIFRNAPLTAGSEAEEWVAAYHKQLFKQGVTTRTMIRHMILRSTMSVPRGQSLDPYEMAQPGFITWMARETGGLIMRKVVELVDESVLRDVRIEEVLGLI